MFFCAIIATCSNKAYVKKGVGLNKCKNSPRRDILPLWGSVRPRNQNRLMDASYKPRSFEPPPPPTLHYEKDDSAYIEKKK